MAAANALPITALATLIATLFQPACASETHDQALILPSVKVIGSTPLPGIGLSQEQIPANMQTLDAESIPDTGAANLPDLLNQRLGSVTINEIQGNPYQPDVNYRGFTASPLLGTPQGLSVYMDGVRLNQPFGDVVSWDIIPRSAISSLNMMPGSNPLFGLNTLGGAISIQTKDGYSNPGTALQALYGSHNRQALEFEHGGHNSNGFHWFVTGNGFKENGWRDDSPTRLGQLFSKLGWMDAKTDVSLSLALAKTKLTGNGLQEQRLLERDYDSVYTKPDETKNRSIFLNLVGKHSVSDDFQLAGNAYYRKIRTSTLNGDINEGSLDQNTYLRGTGATSNANRSWLTNHGYAGQFPTYAENAANTPFPYWACIAQAGQNDEPGEKCNGLINRTETTQENYGWTGQFSAFGNLGEHRNQFTAGAGYDESRMHFRQTTQLGYLNPDRSITGINAYADGVTGGNVDGEPFDNRIDLAGKSRTWSLFVTDTISISKLLHLTLSGRYNETVIHNRDNINPGGGAGSLDGDHRYSRFNPAVGLAITPAAGFSAYVGYNEGSRTPTAIELGCADPANPCKLPNAMAGDPPLKQVVTKTWEAGLRGSLGANTHWSAGIFRADNYDDILFVAAPNTSQFGYFRNFGQTRRQGIELGADTQLGNITFAANYTYLDASFQSNETLNAEANSSADRYGNIAIHPGNRLPMIPRHTLKARAGWQINSTWSLGTSMIASSSSLARGNENGQHQADGTHYVGSGKSAGYAIFNLDAKYRASRQLSFFAHVSNLFDRQYATGAQLGATGFTANGNFIARPFNPSLSSGGNNDPIYSSFYAPGAPRTLWAGIRYEFGQ